MKTHSGRIGAAEAVCAAAVTMCVNGLIDAEPRSVYSTGNSTYISVPAAALLTTLLFLLICRIMQKNGAADLWQLIGLSLGKCAGVPAALMICGSLLICASVPLAGFTRVLDDLVYDGVEFPDLFLFMVPAVLFIAYKGVETIGRTSRLFVWIVAGALIVALAVSIPRQQSYRMYPLLGDGAAHLISVSGSSISCFLPELAALLVLGKSLQGSENLRKTGLKAGLITAGVCFGVRLILARLYTYKGLSSVFMPLCRINYLGIERGYLMWLDKLLVMAWINGAMIAAAYCVYAAGLLYSKAFGLTDVVPPILMTTCAVCVLTLSEYVFGVKAADALDKLIFQYGSLLSLLPLCLTAAFGGIRAIAARKERRVCE